MGVGDYLSDLMGSGNHQHNKVKKKKQLQTVELKVMMDCDGCELKVKKTLSSLDGVKSVEINRKQQKVTVSGYVEASKVLKKAKSTGKKAEIWPYVPYNMVAHAYTVQAYDKKAPPGYVRRVENSATTGTVTAYEDPYTTMFSDENPNACSCVVLSDVEIGFGCYLFREATFDVIILFFQIWLIIPVAFHCSEQIETRLLKASKKF
ncbi:Heavy metal-associated isoprenylated plant protein 23 [Mucuna pruriens]|uniref:Heavy metal-associated isoprenylated plant protein 23 n=1 Tax=Mucuna pruriens TaxID=157652 RepID=A0A371FDX8_MUCPR|nr:Heavy metal-associated isoprenylated plant protein 23 [Mucuna pruriens]